MVRWLPWRRGPNYEHELPRLAAEIRELKLRDISATTRHKRWPTAFVQHALSVIVLYAAYAVLFASNRRKHFTILALVPVALIVGYKLISRLTLWHETRIKSSLKLVEERRQTLVSAYKKQVKFDELMSLIGEDVNPAKPNQSKSKTGQQSKAPNPSKSRQSKPTSDSAVDTKNLHPTANIDGPVPVYQTTWVDRILDLVIGVNENSPASRYALICPHCRAHNGLAPYGKLAEEVSYICRVCNRMVEGPQDPAKPSNRAKEGPVKSNEIESGADEPGEEASASSGELSKEPGKPDSESSDAKAAADKLSMELAADKSSGEPVTDKSSSDQPTAKPTDKSMLRNRKTHEKTVRNR